MLRWAAEKHQHSCNGDESLTVILGLVSENTTFGTFFFLHLFTGLSKRFCVAGDVKKVTGGVCIICEPALNFIYRMEFIFVTNMIHISRFFALKRERWFDFAKYRKPPSYCILRNDNIYHWIFPWNLLRVLSKQTWKRTPQPGRAVANSILPGQTR